MNLLTETREDITRSGHTPADVTFIGSFDAEYSMTWAEFERLADVEYYSKPGKPITRLTGRLWPDLAELQDEAYTVQARFE